MDDQKNKSNESEIRPLENFDGSNIRILHKPQTNKLNPVRRSKILKPSIIIKLDNCTNEDLCKFTSLLDDISTEIKNNYLDNIITSGIQNSENPKENNISTNNTNFVLDKLILAGKSWADMAVKDSDQTVDHPKGNVSFDYAQDQKYHILGKSKLQSIPNVNYKYILECPHGDQCNFQEIYEDDIGRRRKCQYIHSEDDCKSGSRFCLNMVECGKIHGCSRLLCDYSENGPKYQGRYPCRKLFSCPYYHSDQEYEKWVNIGYYDRWSKDPKKYVNPTNFRKY